MLDLLHTPLVVLHVFVCVMLMLVVLIQPGKSGGLGAALGGAGAQQIFGGRGAGNFLTRTTWISASIFFLTSVTLAYLSTSTGDSLQDLAKTPVVTPEPAAPAPAAAAPGAEPNTPPAGAASSAPAPAGDAPAPAAPADAPTEPAPGAPASQP
jgi:preprotein translocase subunit SecG